MSSNKPYQGNKKSVLFNIINSENQKFTVIFSVNQEKLEILINEKASISYSYKTYLELKNFQEINKFFRQFDTIDEIFDFIMSLNEPEEKIKIKIDNKFADLNISLPRMSKTKENNIKIQVPEIELKESDLIVKICQEVKKIDILESKINFIFHCLGKDEQDFNNFQEFMSDFKMIKSNIICISDFFTVSNGIKKLLNKSIKDIKLIYRASRDGDSAKDFHSKCDGIENTVTFVKSINGRKFGGFASEAWNSNNSWISDMNAFLFSLDYKECYYYNNNINNNNINNNNVNNNNCNYTILGSSSSGPVFGYNNNQSIIFNVKDQNSNNDLIISNKCLTNSKSITHQYSFYYNGKISALSGGNNFQVADYETYELTLG